jgi:hypothetical protein
MWPAPLGKPGGLTELARLSRATAEHVEVQPVMSGWAARQSEGPSPDYLRRAQSGTNWIAAGQCSWRMAFPSSWGVRRRRRSASFSLTM